MNVEVVYEDSTYRLPNVNEEIYADITDDKYTLNKGKLFPSYIV